PTVRRPPRAPRRHVAHADDSRPTTAAGRCLSQPTHASRALVDPAPTAPLSTARKWLITVSVMLVTVMQILDTSVTNVALPHMQGSLSAGVEEMTWVLKSFLAANAIIIPATGWL